MKLAFIGGGGVRTVFFCQSIKKYVKVFGISELSLMDNDPEKLYTFGALAKYACSDVKELNITLTTSVEEAVTGADYVVTAIRVGGDHGRVIDERTALDMGILGQETTGAGGFAYAMRTIPVLLDYMRIIAEKSNHATVFHFTNPAGLVTQTLSDAGYHNCIGICDNATGSKIEMSKALGVDSSDLWMRVYGLNHLTWTDSVKYKGTEILGQLMANDSFIEHYHDFQYFDRDLIRRLGMIPNGYLYYYYHRERALKNILKAPHTRGESIELLNRRMQEMMHKIDVNKDPQQALDAYMAFMDERNASYMTTELNRKRNDGYKFTGQLPGIDTIAKTGHDLELLEGYAGVALNYIEAKQKDLGIDMVLNVCNQTAIDGLESSDVIESTCIVDKTGAHPIQIDHIPDAPMLLIRQVKLYERLASQAIRERNLSCAKEALMNHPLVGSWSAAKELITRYAVNHREYLQEWTY